MMNDTTKAIANVLRRKYGVTDIGKVAMVAGALQRSGYSASNLDPRALKYAEKRLKAVAQKQIRGCTKNVVLDDAAHWSVKTAAAAATDDYWDEERPFVVEAAEYFRSCDRCHKPCKEAVKLAEDDVRRYAYCTDCKIVHVPTADEDVVHAG